MNRDLNYLQLLAKQFPSIQAASTEIINLEAILNLPKGTEHFVTDIHGESEAFQHVLKNASGVIRRKVDEIFGHNLREAEFLYIDLLPGRKTQTDQASGDRSGRLVQDDPVASGGGLLLLFVQIYPIQGAEGTSSVLFLHHSGADARDSWGP